MGKSEKTIDTSKYIVKERISIKEKLAYGVGDSANQIIWTGISSFASYYYTNSVGLTAAAVGTMFLISRILDGISDIIMGFLVDNTKSKYGKSRPWILWMAIPFGLIGYLLFSVPTKWSILGKLVYAYITYNMASTVIFTAISVAYSSLFMRMTDNEVDRTSLSAFRMFSAMFCALMINIVVLPMVNAFGGGQHGWSMTFGIFGVIAVILFLLCFLGTKERIGLESTAEQKKANTENTVSTKEMLLSLLKNKYWFNRVLNSVVSSTVTALAAVNVYYCQYWLGNEELNGIISIANVVPMIIALLISTSIAKKMSKRNLTIIATSIGVAGYLIQITAPATLAIVLVGSAFRGIGTGLLSAVTWVMVADVVDYEEYRSGIRSEALISSAVSLGQKVGTGFGGALLGWVLAWGGYDATLAVQSTSSQTAILAVFNYIPLVLQIIVLIISCLFTLEKHLPDIRAELNRRKANSL